jgi:transcriptional regulator with XRE-family HTH domain
MDFGSRIRAARRAAGLSQEELARRAGMSLKGMGDIERGVIPDPHYSSLSKIAEGLGVPIRDLLESEYPKVETPLPEDWSQSFPGEGFPRAVKVATSDELFYAMKHNLGNLPALSLEDFRQDRTAAMNIAMKRSRVFAHAEIVKQELRARPGVEPPEDFLQDFRAWLEALDKE